MSSVLCTNCNTGIHYHGEPTGVEYTFFSTNDWERITSSVFDAKNKVHDEHGYPYLYRASSIELEFPEAVLQFWKCPDCGALIFFDDEALSREGGTYIPVEDTPAFADDRSFVKGILFDDYTWDKLTEMDLPNSKIDGNFQPNADMFCSQEKIVIVDRATQKTTVYAKQHQPYQTYFTDFAKLAPQKAQKALHQFFLALMCDRVEWGYHGKLYQCSGSYPTQQGGYAFYVARLGDMDSEKPWKEKPIILMEHTAETREECLRSFQQARLWDGRTFEEAVCEMSLRFSE